MLRGRALVPLGLIASLAGCGGTALMTHVSRPRDPVTCRSTVSGHSFDARSVLGLPVAVAAQRIKAHGCLPQTVKIDGHGLLIDAAYLSWRIDLTVRDGFVVGVDVG